MDFLGKKLPKNIFKGHKLVFQCHPVWGSALTLWKKLLTLCLHISEATTEGHVTSVEVIEHVCQPPHSIPAFSTQVHLINAHWWLSPAQHHVILRQCSKRKGRATICQVPQVSKLQLHNAVWRAGREGSLAAGNVIAQVTSTTCLQQLVRPSVCVCVLVALSYLSDVSTSDKSGHCKPPWGCNYESWKTCQSRESAIGGHTEMTYSLGRGVLFPLIVNFLQITLDPLGERTMGSAACSQKLLSNEGVND